MSFKETEVGLIPAEWGIYELKDKIEITMGQSPKSEFYNSEGKGIPFMQGRTTFGYKYHSIDTWCTEPKKYAKKNDVLMSVRAPVGDVNIANMDLCIGRGLASLRMNNNNEFLYYLLKNYVDIIVSRESGTVFGSINKSGIENLKLPFPTDDEQKAIAHILSTLDEKIESNNQINKKLEEMAQAIFKQWFVDFEFPCIPKNYKFSGAGKPCNPRGSGKPDDYDKVLTYKRVGGLPVPDGKSWFVYVLLCDDGSFYKGMTKDLYRRFYEHYTGIGAEWTKIHKPVKVIHYEKFNSQQEARKREEELKSGYGREWIKREYKKYQEGSPAHKMKEGLLAHEMKAGLSDHEMKAGSPAHQTHLMIAGEMVESEMGMIPNGWEVKEISDFAKVEIGGDWGKDQPFDDAIAVICLRGTDLQALKESGYSKEAPIRWVKKNSLEKRIMDDTDILIGGSGLGPVGRSLYISKSIYNLYENPVIYSNFCKRIKTVDKFNAIYIEHVLELLYTSGLMNNYVNGTSVPNLDINGLMKHKILIPPKPLIHKFVKFKDYYFNNKLNNENQILIKIRDTLLPKLMSGEIRVPLDN